jgi:hypothetical protein
MNIARSVPAVYARLGVRPVIHGSGPTTRYGGSLMRPETIEALREAAQALVNIDELNEAAGAAIARMLGAEAALVTAGSAAGLVLQAAACITGDDLASRNSSPTGSRPNRSMRHRSGRWKSGTACSPPSVVGGSRPVNSLASSGRSRCCRSRSSMIRGLRRSAPSWILRESSD